MMKTILLLSFTLAFVAACKERDVTQLHVDKTTPLQIDKTTQQWMEQSWSEFIVTLNISNEKYDVNELLQQADESLPIIKIKLFSNSQVIISMKKKVKFKRVYNSLMKLHEVKTIQPNFRYSIPKQVPKLFIK